MNPTFRLREVSTPNRLTLPTPSSPEQRCHRPARKSKAPGIGHFCRAAFWRVVGLAFFFLTVSVGAGRTSDSSWCGASPVTCRHERQADTGKEQQVPRRRAALGHVNVSSVGEPLPVRRRFLLPASRYRRAGDTPPSPPISTVETLGLEEAPTRTAAVRPCQRRNVHRHSARPTRQGRDLVNGHDVVRRAVKSQSPRRMARVAHRAHLHSRAARRRAALHHAEGRWSTRPCRTLPAAHRPCRWHASITITS